MILDLEEKLNGELPINREELIELVSSWGRLEPQTTDDGIKIDKCDPKECYDLSNLDVSQIKDLSFVFRYTMFNGDISNWDISNATKMSCMFGRSLFNNNSLKNWNTSNCEEMAYIFYKSIFNGDISNWDIRKVTYMCSAFELSPFDGDISKWIFNTNIDCDEIFRFCDEFNKKYNDKKQVSNHTEGFLEWFEENRKNIKKLNISDEDILDFFNFNEHQINLKQ